MKTKEATINLDKPLSDDIHDNKPTPLKQVGTFLKSPVGMLGLCLAIMMGALVLITVTASPLSYLLLVLCPLMHVLMMFGFGGHKH